jgi:hypothetical protein
MKEQLVEPNNRKEKLELDPSTTTYKLHIGPCECEYKFLRAKATPQCGLAKASGGHIGAAQSGECVGWKLVAGFKIAQNVPIVDILYEIWCSTSYLDH